MQKALGRAVFRGRPGLGIGGRTQDGKVGGSCRGACVNVVCRAGLYYAFCTFLRTMTQGMFQAMFADLNSNLSPSLLTQTVGHLEFS